MDVVKLMESMSLSEKSEENSELLSFYKAFGVKINDIPTDIIFADHDNKLLIIVSQYQKFGALLSVTKETILNCENNTEPVFTVRPIFGNEDLVQQAAARYIAEKLDIQKPLNIFLCLDKYEQDIIKALANVLVDIQKNI